MQVTIEFYRTRPEDDAHAILARVVRDVDGIEDAALVAERLVQTLDMPQRPDGVTIRDVDGLALRSIVLPEPAEDERPERTQP